MSVIVAGGNFQRIATCRKHGISQQTFYLWKKKYAGLGLNEPRELRQLCEQNTKLKRLVAHLIACYLGNGGAVESGLKIDAGRVLVVMTTQRGEDTHVVTAHPANRNIRALYAPMREADNAVGADAT